MIVLPLVCPAIQVTPAIKPGVGLVAPGLAVKVSSSRPSAVNRAMPPRFGGLRSHLDFFKPAAGHDAPVCLRVNGPNAVIQQVDMGQRVGGEWGRRWYPGPRSGEAGQKTTCRTT